MPELAERTQMAKKAAPQPPPDRVTVLNVKGSESERVALHKLSDETGVPVSEIARRGIAMWAKARGKTAHKDWRAE